MVPCRIVSKAGCELDAVRASKSTAWARALTLLTRRLGSCSYMFLLVVRRRYKSFSKTQVFRLGFSWEFQWFNGGIEIADFCSVKVQDVTIQLLGGMAGWSCWMIWHVFLGPMMRPDPMTEHFSETFSSYTRSLKFLKSFKKSEWRMSGFPFTVWKCFCALLKVQCIGILAILPRHDRYDFVANGAWKMSNMGWYHVELETFVKFYFEATETARFNCHKPEILFVSTRSIESWS